jgi:hypothetical protein
VDGSSGKLNQERLTVSKFDKIRRQLAEPRRWHVISLIASGALLIVLARTQWFFFDEWAFLVPDNGSGLFAPHVGHWSTTPILITHALRAVFGVNTYWPYILLALAIHLAVCHMVWRLSLRSGVNPWIATALSFMLMVLGAGAENILWAFQIGFMGAMLVGLIVIALVDRPELSRRAFIAVIVLSVWSLTFSGTAIPVLLAAGLVSLARRGARTTLVLFAPAAVVYGAWYAIFMRGQGSHYGVGSVTNFGVDLPQYLGHYFIDGLGKVLPFSGLGAIALVCLVAWAVSTFTRWRGPEAPAYALAAAGVAQGFLTAFTRLQLGTETASSSRYIYALVALLIPAIGLAFGWFARNRTPVIAVLVGLVLFVAAYNAALLRVNAGLQSAVELASQQRMYAALELIAAPGASYPSSARVEPQYAPDVTVADLRAMHAAGWISGGSFDEASMLTARTTLQVVLTPAPSVNPATCVLVQPGRADTVSAGAALVLKSNHDETVQLTLTQGSEVGAARTVKLTAGATGVTSPAGLAVTVTVPADAVDPVTVCAD